MRFAQAAVVLAMVASTTGAMATPAYEDEAAGLLADATIVANDNNWLVQDVLDMLEDHQTFEDLIVDVAAAYPNDFSSAIGAATPTDGYDLYFKGTVPAGVAAMITASGLSVTTHANIGKNEAEWDAQVEALVAFLDDEVITDYVVGFDSIDTIELTIGSGVTPPTLPQAIASDVTVLTESGAVFSYHAPVWGGNWARRNGVNTCTTSWNVIHPSGTTGTVTAGHCFGINSILDSSGTPVSSTFQSQRIGLHGDVEWHTTVESEPARFFRSATWWRSVRSVKNTWFRNQWVCGYGRASNNRTCDRIHRTSVSAGGGIRPLVVVRGLNMIPGDSGGGWSFNSQAIGVHAGECTNRGVSRDCFSRASRINNALGVNVRIAP